VVERDGKNGTPRADAANFGIELVQVEPVQRLRYGDGIHTRALDARVLGGCYAVLDVPYGCGVRKLFVTGVCSHNLEETPTKADRCLSGSCGAVPRQVVSRYVFRNEGKKGLRIGRPVPRVVCRNVRKVVVDIETLRHR